MNSGSPRFLVGKNFLQQNALFGGFSDADLDAVLPLLEEETFPAGECIVREGESGNRLYFIESGRADVFKASEKQSGQVRIRELGPGDEFGEMELIDIHPRSATVRAIEPVVVLSLTNGGMIRLYEQHTDIFARLVLNLAREISRRLRKTEQRLY